MIDALEVTGADWAGGTEASGAVGISSFPTTTSAATPKTHSVATTIIFDCLLRGVEYARSHEVLVGAASTSGVGSELRGEAAELSVTLTAEGTVKFFWVG